MNEYFTFTHLEKLLSHQGKPAVSIYLPTTRISTRVQAESLQFKNLLRDAEALLDQFDLRSPEIRAMLAPAHDLVSDSDFWRHQQDGLAVFIGQDTFLTYQVPVTFKTGLFVGDAYHLKPLLPLLTQAHPFYILAVSQNQVRFFHGTRFAVSEIDPATVPASLQEVLSEFDFDKQVQSHTSTSTPGSRQGAIFHGHGTGAPEEEKLRIREYFDRIDRGLQEYLHDESAPLIFAGVDYLFPIYQEANSYPHLVESSIVGNPEELSAEVLQRRAWKFLQAKINTAQSAAVEQLYSALPHGMASTNLAEIVPWADQGRVQTLFIDREAVVWGLYDRENFEVEVHQSVTQQNRDLTDMAAIFTLLRDGNVYFLSPEQMEMEFGPDNRHQSSNGASDGQSAAASDQAESHPAVAAIYRYAV